MTAKIKLNHSGGNGVSLNAPANNPSISDVAFKLPSADGSANQLLKTDGSGNLGWATDQGGKIKNFKYAQTKSNVTTTSSAYLNISALQVTCTPSSSTNLLFFQYALQARVYRNGSNDAKAWIAISDDAGSSYLAENYHRTYDYGGSGALLDIGCSGYHVKAAGSTSARTYYIYVRMETSGAFELNMAANQNNSVCTVTEIEP